MGAGRRARQDPAHREPLSVRGIQVKAGGTQTFNLLAVDGTDDGAVNYDGLMVLQARGEGRASTPAAPLHAGEWQDVPCRFGVGQEARDAVCPVKLLELAPDLRRVRIYFSAVFTLPAFPAGFARKLADRGLYWSGPPDDQRLEDAWAGRPGIDLETWLEQSDRFARFFGEVYQATAAEPGWDLLMGYLPVLGEAGHGLTLTDPRQAGFTPERRDELKRARRRVWQSVDRELARLLAALDMTKTVVVLVSDHGMAAIHTSLDPNALLKEQGLLAMDATGRILPQGTAAYTVGSGGISQVYVAPGRRGSPAAAAQAVRGMDGGGRAPRSSASSPAGRPARSASTIRTRATSSSSPARATASRPPRATACTATRPATGPCMGSSWLWGPE